MISSFNFYFKLIYSRKNRLSKFIPRHCHLWNYRMSFVTQYSLCLYTRKNSSLYFFLFFFALPNKFIFWKLIKSCISSSKRVSKAKLFNRLFSTFNSSLRWCRLCSSVVFSTHIVFKSTLNCIKIISCHNIIKQRSQHTT